MAVSHFSFGDSRRLHLTSGYSRWLVAPWPSAHSCIDDSRWLTHNTQRCRRAYPGLFSPTLHTLIGLQVHCTGFQPFAPWRTAGPSFVASRRGSGHLLRSATSRVSFSCGDLALRTSTAASFSAGRKTRHVPRLRPALGPQRRDASCPAPRVLYSHRGTAVHIPYSQSSATVLSVFGG